MGAGICSGKKNLAAIATLEAHAHDTGNIVPPGDVEDQVGVGRVTGDCTGINGPLGTEA